MASMHPCSGTDLAHAAKTTYPTQREQRVRPRVCCGAQTSPPMHATATRNGYQFILSVYPRLDYLPSRQSAHGASRLSHYAHAIRSWYALPGQQADYFVHRQIRNCCRHAFCKIVVARCDEAD